MNDVTRRILGAGNLAVWAAVAAICGWVHAEEYRRQPATVWLLIAACLGWAAGRVWIGAPIVPRPGVPHRPALRLRFSLRTLMIFMLLNCAGFGWLALRMRQQGQGEAEAAVEEIERTGGHVEFAESQEQFLARPAWRRALLNQHRPVAAIHANCPLRDAELVRWIHAPGNGDQQRVLQSIRAARGIDRGGSSRSAVCDTFPNFAA